MPVALRIVAVAVALVVLAGPAPATRGHASATDPVYLNHATGDELRRLPGVGPKRAQAILVLQQRLGRFPRVEDLLRVKGVGRRAVKKWRPLVRLDTPSADGDDGGASIALCAKQVWNAIVRHGFSSDCLKALQDAWRHR